MEVMTSTFALLDHKFDAANWNYIGEGKMHIVCGYCEIGGKNEISISDSIFSCDKSGALGSIDATCSNYSTSRCDNSINDEDGGISKRDKINSTGRDYGNNNCSNNNSNLNDAMHNCCSSQAIEIEKSAAGAVTSATPLAPNIVTKDGDTIDANDNVTVIDETNTNVDYEKLEICTTKGIPARDDINTSISIKEKNLVLRLTKGYFHEDKVIHDELYVRRIMEPWFLSYCFQRTIVKLPSDFLKGLAIRIHNDRPDGRKRTIIQDKARYGVLEGNLTIVSKPLPASELTGTGGATEHITFVRNKAADLDAVSIELKVKNNDKSTSPFVTDQCNAKLKHGRFNLMQLYKLAKTLNISRKVSSSYRHERDDCNSDAENTRNVDKSNNTSSLHQSIYVDERSSNNNECSKSNSFYRNSSSSHECSDTNAVDVSAQCEWGHFAKISGYDPSDLLSNKKILIKKALNELYKNPQNNLRVSVNGNHLYGGHKTVLTDRGTMLLELQKFFGTHCDAINKSPDDNKFDREEPSTTFLPGNSGIPSTSTVNGDHHDENGVSNGIPHFWNRMIDIVTSILLAEPVMVRIRSMQHLDVLDIEGAACVLNRLESLTGGEGPAQERLLSEMTVPFESSLSSFMHTRTLKFSRKLYESDTSDDNDVCNDTSPIPTLITPSIPSNQPQTRRRTEGLIEALDELQISKEMDNNERNLRLTQAHQWVSTLEENDCAVLLKMHLTALAAKDCSVILSMEPVQRSLPPPAAYNLPNMSSTPISISPLLNNSLSNTNNDNINTNTNKTESVLLNDLLSTASLPYHLSPPNLMKSSQSLSQWKILNRQSVETSGIMCLPSSSGSLNHTSSSTSSCPSSSTPSLETAIPADSPLLVPCALPLLPTIPSLYLAYSIGVVDVGPKPGSKIRDKMGKEEGICSIVSIVEKHLNQP